MKLFHPLACLGLSLALPLSLPAAAAAPGRGAPAAAAQETTVTSRIESVGLFKNGLAVVRRVVEVDGPGTYRVEDVPSPVHGTFWVESPGDLPVSTRVTMREVDAPARGLGALDFQSAFVGKRVTIHFRGEGIPPATGTVVEIARPRGDDAWNRTYQPERYGGYRGYAGVPPTQPGQFLVLETDKGRTYADASLVAHVAIEGATETVKRRLPVLLLTVGDEGLPGAPAAKAGDDDDDARVAAAAKPKAKPAAEAEEEADVGGKAKRVTITYLAKGIAWAPSYRVNLVDGKTLTVEQQAVVKNEMEGFEDAEVQLISGFPSMQFAHVTSPLSLDTTWAGFFAQLSQQPQESGGLAMSNMRQQVRMNNEPPGDPSVDLSATPTGEGVDLHYQPVGVHTMAEGDALALWVAQGEAAYERLVEWVVPDTREANGRYIEEYRRQQEPDKFQDSAWDAVRFKNPLAFPMTTAPALVTSGGKFNGQRMSYFVNAGEQTTLHVTKALSVRTRATEQEQQGQERDVVFVGGNDYRKVSVSGELSVNNHRKEDIKLVIRRQFSGELVSAEGEPRQTLREEGVYSVNRRNELNWTLTLKSGEGKTLKYKYTVLVDN